MTATSCARAWVRVGRQGVAGALLLILIATILSGVAAASQQVGREETPALREEAPWATGADGMALWFWPEQRRAYQLLKIHGYDTMVSFDVDTREEVARTKLSPDAWGPTANNNEYTTGGGRHLVADVDREHGRVFVAYQSILQNTGALTLANEVAKSWDQFCVGFGNPGCVGGIHVLDATTLEPIHNIELMPPTVGGQRLQFVPRALTYVPADPDLGWSGKVVMIVEEIGTGPTENSIVPSLVGATQNAVQRRNGNNLAYAVQFDPDTGRQEWIVRLEGCRNSRENRGWMGAPEGHPSTVFRRGGPKPSLYVGCHSNTQQQGVVVRLPLDAAGNPSQLPVDVTPPGTGGPPDPTAAVTLAPRQEMHFGPDNVTVMLSDPTSERLLMRVDDSGEVWWVFDATVDQFIGTIGIGDYRHGHTTFGLDPDTGRLYVLAATARDTTGPGGLYLADIRRNPVPQALHYPEFADPPRTGVGLATGGGSTDVGREMSVLPRVDGHATRLYQVAGIKAPTERPTFRVIVDASPISQNSESSVPPVRTLDIAEADGVTSATFDGTARGFGFRTLLVGGIEGATRVGPADAVGLARGLRHLDGWNYEYKTGSVTVDSETLAQPLRDRADSTELGPIVPPLPYPTVHQESVSSGEQGVGVTGELIEPIVPAERCADVQREMIVAFVGPRGPAVVDASSARGEAQPLVFDTNTRGDAAAPLGRCLPWDWEQLWQRAMFGRPPLEEPGVQSTYEESRVSCTATEEDVSESWSDPAFGAFSAEVECSPEEAGGWGQARGITLDRLSVAGALSSFRIYRDPSRGMVSRVESITRGVDIGGIVQIDTVRGSAESWANGRRGPQTPEEVTPADGNPFNCDSERPAGTCFRRQVFGVTVRQADGSTAYRCGPCGPEDQFIEAMNRGLGAYGYARFRAPDPALARGSEDGYVAAVTKRDAERFADVVLNNDLLETMVPMLEVVRYAPHNRPDSTNTPEFSLGVPPRGRQIYQFAAVEVSSTYGIQCLLVHDEATNTCAPAAEETGALTVRLTDAEGQPLAGGAFAVRHDSDTDGVVGLADELVSNGACVTAEDGIGTCTFPALPAGPYLVTQTLAPPGHGVVADPWPVELAAGEARTVEFINVSNLATVNVTATDDTGAPITGATFAVYPDPDADGRVADGATPAASCTTDSAGQCSMQVPAASWVLVQTATSDGRTPMDPLPFTFASGGQVAAVDVVNTRADTAAPQPPTPAPGPAPGITYTTPPTLTPSDTAAPLPEPTPEPRTSAPDRLGGTVIRVIRAPGDALRLLGRSPVQALAWSAALALLALAAGSIRRRHLLLSLALAPVPAGATVPRPSTSRPGGTTRPSDRGPTRPSGGPNSPAAKRTRPRHTTRPPVVAGGSPGVGERTTVRVLAATGSEPLASVVRQRLAAAPGCELLAVVGTWGELRSTLEIAQPGVLLVDLGLRTGGPQDLCDLLPGLHAPAMTVGLIPPNRSRIAIANRGRAAGLGGMLAAYEDIGNGNLAYALRSVADGKPCHGPTVQAVLLAADETGTRTRRGPTDLTPRELEIAMIAAEGASRTVIAERLHLSPGTVKRHLRAVRAKLGVTNPRDAAQLRHRLQERLGRHED